jgi:hypothetical protein
MSLRSLALYIEPTAVTPTPSARGPQVIFIMALLLCALGSLDPALFSLIAYR